MLLPPMNLERQQRPPSAVQGNDAESKREPKLPLRECHSIPHSLPPSFPERAVSELATLPTIDNLPQAATKQRSKSVRFSISEGMVQYFNPTEMTRSVHKSTLDIGDLVARRWLAWLTDIIVAEGSCPEPGLEPGQDTTRVDKSIVSHNR